MTERARTRRGLRVTCRAASLINRLAGGADYIYDGDLDDQLGRGNKRTLSAAGYFCTTSRVTLRENTGFVRSLEWILMSFRRGPLSPVVSTLALI
jgi:hypothetical protein